MAKMRSLAMAFVLWAMPIQAVADGLPFVGAYGTPLACIYFKLGGFDAVDTGGGTLPNAPADAGDPNDPILLLEGAALHSHEWGCDIISVRKNENTYHLSMTCEEAGGDGPSPEAGQLVSTGDDLFQYSDQYGSAVLRKCEGAPAS